MKKIVGLLLLISIVFVFSISVSAEQFPERSLRYIVPYDPGGLSDITARRMQSIISEKDLLDVSFNVHNISGASAGHGMIEVRDADPDGHTLLHHHTSFITHRAAGVRDWGFEEYTPVALLFEVPAVLFTYSGRYESLEEWIEDVENNPGETTFAVSSLGGNAHLFAEQVLDSIGIRDKLEVAAYGAGGPMFTAMLGEEDDISAAPLPQAMEHHEAGDMKILATGTEERLPFLPDVPTLKELGYPIPLNVAYRMGVWAPPETPQERVDYLYDFFEELITSEEFEEAAEDLGVFPNIQPGERLYELFEQDDEVINDLLEELDL